MSEQRHAWWAGVAVLVAAVWTFSGCGSEAETGPGASASGGTTSAPGASSGGSSGDRAGSTSSPGGSGGPSSGDASTGANATPANFKVAFIGDTGAGRDFKDVLALIKRENAQAVFIQGDVEYGGELASDWLPVIDGALQAGGTNIPYFVSRGNHDDDWNLSTGLGPALESRMTAWGITPDNNKAPLSNYAFTFKGLKVVMVREQERVAASDGEEGFRRG